MLEKVCQQLVTRENSISRQIARNSRHLILVCSLLVILEADTLVLRPVAKCTSDAGGVMRGPEIRMRTEPLGHPHNNHVLTSRMSFVTSQNKNWKLLTRLLTLR